MLRTESGKFLEFVGARVSEVKVNSNVEVARVELQPSRPRHEVQGRAPGYGLRIRIPGGDAMDGDA
jgi:hypothetical protein